MDVARAVGSLVSRLYRLGTRLGTKCISAHYCWGEPERAPSSDVNGGFSLYVIVIACSQGFMVRNCPVHEGDSPRARDSF